MDSPGGGAPGDLFKVVPSSESHVISDFSFWDEATVNATETFTNLNQATTDAEQQAMQDNNCGPQNGSCDISDFSTSDTTVAGLPAKLIKANGVNEDLGWTNVYVTGLGKWEYTITFNNIPNDNSVTNLISSILKGLSIKPSL